MRKVREILRLRLGLGLSERQAAEGSGVGRTTVRDTTRRAAAAGLTWPLPDDLDDTTLEERLYPSASARQPRSDEPDWAHVHAELKRPGVTRELLWQEYLGRHPDGISYSRFCELYRDWMHRSRISMRQEHRGGEKLFVDFAGTTIPVTDGATGEVRRAQVFVATWGASNYTYAEAAWSQDVPTWTRLHVNACEYFGCVPRVVVTDNLKSAVTKACRYDPDVNETYAEVARHYGFAVIPARVGRPKDKAKVEFGVRLVTRWITAALRNRTFFDLDELNAAIRELLERLNARPFQKMAGSRASAFQELEKPAALPLPQSRYVWSEVRTVRVNVDYHVAVDDHFYSVPFQLRGTLVRVLLTSSSVEILHKNRRVAAHVRSYQKWAHSTVAEHMPSAHRRHGEWTPSRIAEWARQTGPSVAELAAAMMEERPHPEQGYRACLGLIRLAARYGAERVDAACRRALEHRAHRYKYVKSILARGLDREGGNSNQTPPATPAAHENIRGADYYKDMKEEHHAG